MKRPPAPQLPRPVEMTEEQLALAIQYVEIEHKIDALRENYQNELRALKASVPKCKTHIWVLEKGAEYRWFNNHWSIDASVYCGICGTNGWWFCPKNPTLQCVYDQSGDEYCIHCGAPDERK